MVRRVVPNPARLCGEKVKLLQTGEGGATSHQRGGIAWLAAGKRSGGRGGVSRAGAVSLDPLEDFA